MQKKIYNFLVNRHDGISYRYHNVHDNTVGFKKCVSWVYLLLLNFAYYVLFCHFLGKRPLSQYYEEKALPVSVSESFLYSNSNLDINVEHFVEVLSKYDVISFDIFDTLIYRPFSDPTDLFHILGTRFHVLNFKQLRKLAERNSREEVFEKRGNYEVSISDIWNVLSEMTGIVPEVGIRAELEIESGLCYSNPFMKCVFDELVKLGKKVIIISDMYLSQDMLDGILKKNGYQGYNRIYVSCEYNKSKASGELYDLVRSEEGNTLSYIHVGDNIISDVKRAAEKDFATLYYPNANYLGNKYRAMDMSALVGGAYRGVINNNIYSGWKKFSLEYEFGFIYGGLFVLGYCNFIHEYYEKNKIDKLLFLSRDGDILLQAYEILFPNDNKQYVYWSRKAATKLEFFYERNDYYKRFLYHKVNQGLSMKQIFASMELDCLLTGFILANENLTSSNVMQVKQYLNDNADVILKIYEGQELATKKYYVDAVGDNKTVLAIDIGWAGSGAVALSYLIEERWKISCKVIGMLAGTNTIFNDEPDASESFLQSGKLVSYLYSQSHNRDILKKHNLNKNYNVYWELLLSSQSPQFYGYLEGNKVADNNSIYIDRLDITLCFGEAEANQKGILLIQKGILDFVNSYYNHFKEFPFMLNISGRDAYAPMLLAASGDERYLKKIEKFFNIEINVN